MNSAIYCINCSEKTLKKYYNFFGKNQVKVISLYDNKDLKVNENIKSSPMYKDYIRLKFIYENPGLLLDGEFEFMSSLNNFYSNNLFLAFKDENTVVTNIIWSKSKNNKIIGKLLKLIEENPNSTFNECLSEVLNINVSQKYNSLVKMENDSFIYPYDYFFPIDYEKHGKQFSENTVAIFYDNKPLSFKSKLKLKTFKKVGAPALHYILVLISNVRFKITSKIYDFKNRRKTIFFNSKIQKETIMNAIQRINNIANNEYIVFHNPNWLGVTSASKELFDNLIPLEEVVNSSYLDKLVYTIKEKKIKQVIFSAFVDGWDILARKLKNEIPDISLKSFWHGSHSQVIEEINWRTNLLVINLHKQGIIDVMGTCKESLLNFYKSQNYKAAFIQNNVHLTENLKEVIEEEKSKTQNVNQKLRIGMYAAGLGWRKNMFTQLAAATLFENSIIDSVPLSFDSQVFISKFNNEIEGVTNSIKREEILKRLAKNDINLYVTFSECAPMLPIESMEVGTICLTGDNNHYFKNTSLEKYLIVDREDDVIDIYNKMKNALDNKEEIFRLYKVWKSDYDKKSKVSVDEFLKM